MGKKYRHGDGMRFAGASVALTVLSLIGLFDGLTANSEKTIITIIIIFFVTSVIAAVIGHFIYKRTVASVGEEDANRADRIIHMISIILFIAGITITMLRLNRR